MIVSFAAGQGGLTELLLSALPLQYAISVCLVLSVETPYISTACSAVTCWTQDMQCTQDRQCSKEHMIEYSPRIAVEPALIVLLSPRVVNTPCDTCRTPCKD